MLKDAYIMYSCFSVIQLLRSDFRYTSNSISLKDFDIQLRRPNKHYKNYSDRTFMGNYDTLFEFLHELET